MRHVLTGFDFVVLLLAVAGVLLGRSRNWGWLLLVTSGLWLPLNNGVLEGPTILPVTGDHGLTVSDLVGIAGAVLAGFRLWPPGSADPPRPPAARAAVVAGVVVAGFLLALVVTDERVDERRDRQLDRSAGPAPDSYRNSFDIRRSASGLPPVWQVGQYWNDLS